MDTAERARYVAALDESLLRFSIAEEMLNLDDVWRETRNLLGWLYRFEEAERSADAQYYVHRDASHNGRTLAGLIWVRGVVEHHQAEVREVMENVIGDMRAPTRGQFEQFSSGMVVRATQWPERATLPLGVPERHGRDIWYDQYVAGRSFLTPPRQARDYLVEERGQSQ